MSMTSKHEMLVIFLEGLIPIKSQDPLTTFLARSRDKENIVLFPQFYGYQKVLCPYSHINL